MNPDGSKTVYETNGATHRSVATTTDAKGKARGRIIYQLDNEGRYESGAVFNASGKFRFKTLYRYDSGGRLSEETQLAKDGTVLHKIVYSFDAAGTRAVIPSTMARAPCSGERRRNRRPARPGQKVIAPSQASRRDIARASSLHFVILSAAKDH